MCEHIKEVLNVIEEEPKYTNKCEHIKDVLDAYRDLVAQANGAEPHEDYKKKFYRLLNHKNEVL